MSKTNSYTFGSEHDKCATSATPTVTLSTTSCTHQETPVLSSNTAHPDWFTVAPKQRVWHQRFVELVLKHSKATSNVLKDCQDLSDSALNSKYQSEYQSWRNMMRRAKDGIREVHPAFYEFRLFLISVGTKPRHSHTLDRPDNGDLEYSPTNARWASKREQNRNKSDTIVVVCPKTGKTWFTAALAKKHGVDADTIRARRRRGWNDAELIAGHRLPSLAVSPVSAITPATALEPAWAAAMSEHFPDKLAVLNPAGRKQLGNLENLCREAGVSAAEVLTSVIANWDAFVFETAHERGLDPDRLPAIPQPQFLARCSVSAVNFWAQQVGCPWNHGIPVPPSDAASPSPASPDLAEKL